MYKVNMESTNGWLIMKKVTEESQNTVLDLRCSVTIKSQLPGLVHLFPVRQEIPVIFTAT